MGSSLFSGKNWSARDVSEGFGSLELVRDASFCDMAKCVKPATWRVGYGRQSVRLCSKHTVSTMRNSRLWFA